MKRIARDRQIIAPENGDFFVIAKYTNNTIDNAALANVSCLVTRQRGPAARGKERNRLRYRNYYTQKIFLIVCGMTILYRIIV